MTPPSSDLNLSASMATRVRNLLVALSAIILTLALFLGLQTQHPAHSLSELAEKSTPLEVAVANGKPTLVEFYANWCLTCQGMVPDMVALRDTYEDRVNFVMLNVDNPKWLPELETYRVDGIPHFVFLNAQGEAIAQSIGEVPKPIFTEKLNALIAGIPVASAEIPGKVSSLQPGSSATFSSNSDPRSHGSQAIPSSK